VQRFLGPTNISDRLTLPVIWHLLGWQLLLNFLPLPLANNFWTDLIFLSCLVRSLCQHVHTVESMNAHGQKREKDKSGPFLFPFTGFGAVPSPLLFFVHRAQVQRVSHCSRPRHPRKKRYCLFTRK